MKIKLNFLKKYSIEIQIKISKEIIMKCPRCGTEMKDLGDKVICPKCGFEIIKENNKTPKLKPINDAESSKQQHNFPLNEDFAIL